MDPEASAPPPVQVTTTDDVDVTPRSVFAVRMAFAVIGLLLYPLVMGQPGDRPWMSGVLLAVGAPYGFLVWRWSKSSNSRTTRRITNVCDIVLISLWLFATGGFDSPFFFIIYIGMVLVSMRSTVSETFAFAGLYCVGYLAVGYFDGALTTARLADIVIRCTYVLFAAGTGAVVSTQRLAQARTRMLAARKVEQQQVNEQIYEAERLAALGTLAGGVGHEINNPLTWVITNVSFARNHLRETGDSAVLEALDDAADGAARISTIVADLKVFTRGDETLGMVDIPALLRTALKMASNEIRHRAQLVEDLPDVPHVLADQARLGQVFLNLLANAAQAMEVGRADENELRVRTRVGDDDEVVVEIEDTGAGMSSHVAERVFEPFYTTKPAGHGTGLGLAISHRIVTNFGGRIEVDSTIGRGTTVRVILPAAQTRQASRHKASVEEKLSALRILVVDDEPLILRAIPRMLPRDLEVETTTSGREALDRVRGGEVYDVILSDLIMPVMSGMELHQALAEEAPDLARRMVFMTGGAFTSDAREFLARDGVRWLEKPIDPVRLLSLLRQQSEAAVTPPE